MKSTLFFLAAFAALFVAPPREWAFDAPNGGHSPQAETRGVPRCVADAANGAGEMLAGIGSANWANMGVARRVATLLALGDISTQLQALVTIVINEHAITSEADPEKTILFREVAMQAISQSTLRGAAVVHEFMDEDGYYWVVATLDRGHSLMEIEAAAGIASERAAGFDAGIFTMDRVGGIFDSMIAPRREANVD